MINQTASIDSFAPLGSAQRVIEMSESLLVIEMSESLLVIASDGHTRETFPRSLAALDIALASVCHDLWSEPTWHGFRVRADALRQGLFSASISTIQVHLAAMEGLIAQYGPPSETEPDSLSKIVVAGSVVSVLSPDSSTDPEQTFITVSGKARWCSHLHPTVNDAEPCARAC